MSNATRLSAASSLLTVAEAPAEIRRDLPIFKAGNSKLGPGIATFSIPAGATCPGATAACLSRCYARKGYFRMASNKRSFAAAEARTRDPHFVRDAVAELRRRPDIKVVRVHVAGDLYSPDYARKWVQIMRRSPQVRFFLYTRSWRFPEYRPPLRSMARLPNVTLHLSEDRETLLFGRPPEIAGARRAFAAFAADDEPLVPDRTDIVFRNVKGTPAKRLSGAQVCPVEQGVGRKVEITCSTCRLCIDRHPSRR